MDDDDGGGDDDDEAGSAAKKKRWRASIRAGVLALLDEEEIRVLGKGPKAILDESLDLVDGCSDCIHLGLDVISHPFSFVLVVSE